MRGHSSIILGTFICAIMAISSGCVPQDRYDNLYKTHLTLKEENIVLQDKIDAQENANRLLQQRLADAGGSVGTLEAQNRLLRGEVDNMAGSVARMEDSIRNMEFILPAEVNLALQRLADQHPGLLTYDPQQGMVRFSSDLTFDLGSADLKPEAAQSLRALAGILNDPALGSYEVRVVGHTDAVPIVNEGTKRNHPTNLHLSVHRAISVADALRSGSVDPRRVQVAGYGQYRPVVREAAGGAAQNRRVEIFIVPMTGTLSDLPAAASSNTTAPPAREEINEPMK
ncbi:MAG: OmpA/MotB family protein [Phycisphaerales bacterium]